MSKLSKYNDGFKFITVLIDILSKYAWLELLKSKHRIAIKNALEHIFSETIRRRKVIQTDKGTEFFNALVKTYIPETTSSYLRHIVNEVCCDYVSWNVDENGGTGLGYAIGIQRELNSAWAYTHCISVYGKYGTTFSVICLHRYWRRVSPTTLYTLSSHFIIRKILLLQTYFLQTLLKLTGANSN